MRPILLARKEPQKWPPLFRLLVANSAQQHRISRLHSIHDRTHRHRPRNLHLDLAVYSRQVAQMVRQHHPHPPDRLATTTHCSVCTSTDSTDGSSCKMAFHELPPSGEQYTCPPVVPKYTPQSSSRSTAIASRSTFT